MLLDRILPARPSRPARTRPRVAGDASSTPAPDADYWYGPVGGLSAAGVLVTPESALGVAAVWRAVTMLARDVGSLGCVMYRRLATGGKVRASGHPLFHVLRYRPNAWQTAVEYWEMVVGHMATRGNHYSRIVAGTRGFADQLVPFDPTRMRVTQLQPSRRLAYFYTPANGGPEEPLLQDEVFHLRWYCLDGLTGVGPISYARQSLGLTIAAESYGARFFSQNSRPAGALQTPQTLTDDQYRRVREQWELVHGGLSGAHKTAILEKGLTWQQIGLSNEDAQFLATREFQTREVANWFGVPEHKLAMAKTPTFASIEAYNIDYYTSGVQPICVKIEQAILRDLILAEDTYFAEFLMEGRLRGDTQTRSTFYHNAVLDGWMTRNEVRERENLNALPGLDEPLEPRNMAPAGTQGVGQSRVMSAVDPAVTLAHLAANRCVRKELAAIRKVAQRCAAKGEAWAPALAAFYAKHAAFMAEACGLDLDTARRYADSQMRVLLTEGLLAAEDWARTLPPELATLIIRGDGHAEPAITGGPDAAAAAGDVGADEDGAVGVDAP